MTIMKRAIVCIFILIGLLAACSPDKKHFLIGVSQCSDDIWREKQNAELRMGAYLNAHVELCFAAAYDSDERQVQQIDSLLQMGIDLLIVAPNQVQTISPAIDRAFDQGIPVIVFERKTSSQKYTAFISADNYEMGHVMGEYVASALNGQGSVLEIMGLKGSSPAIERHNGFMDALKGYPSIVVVDTLQGDWTEESAYNSRLLTSPLGEEKIDFVFAQNDRMAMGARRAIMERRGVSSLEEGLPRFCGIDGLPDHDGGIRLVRDSILDATYIYPTRGDVLLQLAVDILDGKDYPKETSLMSALVTKDNANVLLMQSDEIMRQSDYLDRLHARADNYLQELDTQHLINYLTYGIIVLLIISLVLLYRYHIGKVTLRRERVVNNLWNMENQTGSRLSPGPSLQGRGDDTPTTEETGLQGNYSPPYKGGAGGESGAVGGESEEPAVAGPTSHFITRFKEVVEKRLSDSDLSVEDIGMEMSLSRVQLYRKVKALTGSSPIDLLRKARLDKGYQLLVTSDLNVSEIAYKVGFTSPSYFTKCFKDEYGQVPGDVRKE